MNRVKRPPIYCWAKTQGSHQEYVHQFEKFKDLQSQYQSLVSDVSMATDEFDANHLKIMSVTWNMQGKTPNKA